MLEVLAVAGALRHHGQDIDCSPPQQFSCISIDSSGNVSLSETGFGLVHHGPVSQNVVLNWYLAPWARRPIEILFGWTKLGRLSLPLGVLLIH